ncbi:hypothetical protein DFH06DRAFT_630660 [Mycena polygramma]|nr:hypothetical protein DFH06DRAFT_630660 [Mycena polygramma]
MHFSLITSSVILATCVAAAPTSPQLLPRWLEIPTSDFSCGACAKNLSETVPSCAAAATPNPYNSGPMAANITAMSLCISDAGQDNVELGTPDCTECKKALERAATLG